MRVRCAEMCRDVSDEMCTQKCAIINVCLMSLANEFMDQYLMHILVADEIEDKMRPHGRIKC